MFGETNRSCLHDKIQNERNFLQNWRSPEPELDSTTNGFTSDCSQVAMAYHGISLVFGDAQKKVLAGCACKIALFFPSTSTFCNWKKCQEVLRDADLSGPLMICLTLGQNASASGFFLGGNFRSLPKACPVWLPLGESSVLARRCEFPKWTNEANEAST